MGRPTTGSVRQRGQRWLASVPRLSPPGKRLECSFMSEAEADAWVDEQLARRATGLEPIKPAQEQVRQPRADPTAVAAPAEAVGELYTLEDYARAWHAEQYEKLHGAGPDRAKDVLDDIEIHLLPAFGGPIETNIAHGRLKIVAWTRRMAGYPPAAADPPLENVTKTYALATVTNLLWILTEILRYAHTLGADVRMVLWGWIGWAWSLAAAIIAAQVRLRRTVS